ncbi:MAG: helix-turn-helix domain-containing protein [Xenococcaceae cyanobacterium]
MQGSLSISQISDRLSFKNSSQFTHFFHKNTGLSPSMYRQTK